MVTAENQIKQLAKSTGELVKKYGKTEIICTTDINPYVICAKSSAGLSIRDKKQLIGVYNQNTHHCKPKNKTVIHDAKFKCYSCGKSFVDNKDLTRHKNRKTPCIIREVAPENVANPNRCIYCNKIFANLGNKNKHFKICKIKNGDINVLAGAVKYDQEIRILKEQNQQVLSQNQRMQEQLNMVMCRMEAFERTAATDNTFNS